MRTLVTVAALALLAMVVDYLSHRVAPGTVLMVRLEGPIAERGSTSVVGAVRGGHETALNVVRRAIDRASRDPRIEGLAIEIIDPTMELAEAQELCGLIRRFADEWQVDHRLYRDRRRVRARQSPLSGRERGRRGVDDAARRA